MKSTFFCYLTIIMALTTHTLCAAPVTGSNDLSARINKTLYVVLNNDAEVNAILEKCFVENWTLSELAFITKEEYREIKAASDNLFIMLSHNEGVDGNTFIYENTMQVFYLVRSGTYRVNITGVPVGEMTQEAALENAVRLLQDKLKFQLAKEQEDVEFDQYADAANSRTDIIRTKALYIASEDLENNISGIDVIKELYSGEVFIVSASQLQEIIEQKPGNVAYVAVENFKSGLSYVNSKQVIDAADGTVLYFDESKGMKAGGFSKSDFSALQK